METDAETLEVSWAQLKASPAWTYLVVPLLSERRKSLYEKLAISGSIEDVRYIQGQIAVLTDVLETPTKASRAATKAGKQEETDERPNTTVAIRGRFADSQRAGLPPR